MVTRYQRTIHPPRTLAEFTIYMSKMFDRDPVLTLVMISIVADIGIPLGGIDADGVLTNETQQVLVDRFIEVYVLTPQKVSNT